MECLPQPIFKKPRRTGPILRDVTNTLRPLPLYSNPDQEVALKLLSVLEGDFESPGFTDRLLFIRAAHRQKQITESKDQGVVYDLAWDDAKGGYTRGVADWDWLSDEVFHVRWWTRGRQYCCWNRDLRFWTYDELQEIHREGLKGSSGPQHDDWCRWGDSIQWDVFWSSAILWKHTGSSGVKKWDDQFRAMSKLTKK